jgi:hypothetical protein
MQLERRNVMLLTFRVGVIQQVTSTWNGKSAPIPCKVDDDEDDELIRAEAHALLKLFT